MREVPRCRHEICDSCIGALNKASLWLLARASLDEALGFAVGLGQGLVRMYSRPSRLQSPRTVAGTVIDHHPLNLDIQAFMLGDGGLKEGGGVALSR